MKGLILAAGLGTRLRPITSLAPKPTISVANKPLIHYAVDNLIDAGISEIGIVVSPNTMTSIRTTLEDYRGASYDYIVQNPPKGLAHAVQVSQDFLGDDQFVMYLSDNLFEHGVKDMVASFDAGTMNAMLALIEVEDPRALGVAVVENERITKLVEKPKVPPSNLAVAGVYVFDKRIHDMIKDLKPGAKGEYQITDAIQMLIDDGAHVASSRVTGWWKDTGKPEDILDANRLLLLQTKRTIRGTVEDAELVGEVYIAAGASIKNSTIFGPVLIGCNTVIEDAFIGPYTTVGNNSRIVNAELEYAVVGQNTTVESVKSRIQGSLIGEHVEITGRDGRPSTHKLTIGDMSKVILQET